VNLMQPIFGRGDIAHIHGIGRLWRSLWAYKQGSRHVIEEKYREQRDNPKSHRDP
jgi:hypothetical protein